MECGHTKIVKNSVPLIDNLNAPNKNGETPIEVPKSDEILGIIKSFKKSKLSTK